MSATTGGLIDAQVRAMVADGATASEAAAALGVEPAMVAVATGGANGSAAEKAAIVAALVDNLTTLAFHSDNDSVRAKASIFLINEHKGRNDVEQGGIAALATFGIARMNEELRKAREAAFSGIVDITPEPAAPAAATGANRAAAPALRIA